MSEALYNELQKPEYSGLDTAARLALLNTKDIEYFIQPAAPDITNYLMNTGLYAKLIAVYRTHPVPEIRVAAECALDLAQSQIPFVNLENANIQTMLGALVQGGVWTQAEANGVLDFGRRYRSRADEILERDATEADLGEATQWPVISQMNALQAAAAQANNGIMDFIQAARIAALEGEPVPPVQQIKDEYSSLFDAALNTQTV